MSSINENVSREIASAWGDGDGIANPALRPISINREGSGHTVNINDTIGAAVTGLVALILLWALLRSEARYRKLLEQTRPLP